MRFTVNWPSPYITYPLQILYLIVILKYPLITSTNAELRQWINQCKTDYTICPKCFHTTNNADDDSMLFISNSFQQMHPPPATDDHPNCNEIEQRVTITNDDIIKTFNNLFGAKQISYGNYSEPNDMAAVATRVVLKYLFDRVKFDKLVVDVCEYLWEDELECEAPFNNVAVDTDEVVAALQRRFRDKEQVDGCVICPSSGTTDSIDRFSDLVSDQMPINEVFKWLLLNLNVQPLLLSLLNEQNFNVPKLINSYGFVTVEQNDGITLYNFYESSIEVRLLIAKHLLKAVIRLTEGVHGFRIYLTDINPDNIVVDAIANHSVSFVDLDNCILLDTTSDYHVDKSDWKTLHVHEKIECKGCFAYVPQEICQHHISDLNVFSVCQLLHEDLFNDTNKGFLHSLPDTNEHFVHIKRLVRDCQTCSTYTSHGCDRFEIANQLIKQIDFILNDKNQQK